MSKKIIISLSVIGAIAAVVGGATIAYFNDTETSTGNILIAGEMDLQVDHTWQTYNDVACNTCDLTLKSDESNMVVKRNGVDVTPYPAVFVGSTNPPGFSSPNWFHSAWTAQNDPILSAAGAKWIWESDPTKDEDTRVDVTYTFEKKFEWYGPIVSTDLYFAIGSDNSIKVWMNDELIAENNMEFGYREGDMLHVPASLVNDHIKQGDNVLTFEVKNWKLLVPPGTSYNNPGGLIYKFYISGDCKDVYFKENCELWGLKDLGPGDTFWNFDDIKPGDHGTNVISLHAYNNDAYACLITHYIQDLENTLVDPELALNDTAPTGELSQFLKAFVWVDSIQNNTYDVGETILYGPNVLLTDINTMTRIPLAESQTEFIGLAWCAGTQSVDGAGVISCDGSTMGNIAQTDIMNAYFTAYAEQQRHEDGFTCSGLQINKSSPMLFQP